MLNTEESQRSKRRTDSTESNGAFEKKQRVEQLVTALARPTRKHLSSTSSLDSVDLKMDEKLAEEVEDDINIDVVSTDDSPPSPLATMANDDKIHVTDKKAPADIGSSFSPPVKPVAKVVHFSPKIIQVESIAETKTTNRSKISSGKPKKNSSAFVPPPIPSGAMMELSKATPQTMTRVPRDQNVPLIVYNPPRPKPMGATGAPVLPVLPMTTCGNLIIQAPALFSPPGTIPPTLIPASQLKKIAKQTSFTYVPVKPATKLSKPGQKEKKPQVPSNEPVKQEQREVTVKKENVNETPTLPTKSHKNFQQWTVNEVYEHFLKSDCAEYANIFKEQEIDGKALSHLDEMNIPKLLNVKMGPAIKISAIIRSLKNF